MICKACKFNYMYHLYTNPQFSLYACDSEETKECITHESKVMPHFYNNGEFSCFMELTKQELDKDPNFPKQYEKWKHKEGKQALKLAKLSNETINKVQKHPNQNKIINEYMENQ